MANELIQADYEALALIAQRFGHQSQLMEALYARVQRSAQNLQHGDWVGRGLSAFSAEMNGEVLPALSRLVQALGQAQSVTLQIRDLIQRAEEDAAQPFQGGEAAGLPTGAGQNGSGTPAGAASGSAGALGATSSGAILNDPSTVFNEAYMKDMVGRHFQGEDSPELNRLMENLFKNPQGAELQETLNRIADLRGVPRAEFQRQYARYLEIRQQDEAKNGPIEGINETFHGDFLGSTASLRYGKVVGDVMGLDPVFGSLLNPTGGLVGPGNKGYNPGDNSAIGYHGIFHDAAGYLYNRHDLGPGYDYLGQELNRDTSDPLTGQRSGIRWWINNTNTPGPDFISDPLGAGLVDTAIDFADNARNAYNGFKDSLGALRNGNIGGFLTGAGRASGSIARIPVDIGKDVASTVVDTVGSAAKKVWDSIF